MGKAVRLSLLKLLDRAPEKLDVLASNADRLAATYLRILEEEGLRLGVYDAITRCVTLASARSYGEAVRLAARQAPQIVVWAARSPADFAREAWRAYVEITSPAIPLGLLPEEPVIAALDPGHFRVLAQILHAAYLVSGSWEARYASILVYAASLMEKLDPVELVELLLLAPASYRAHRNGDREWSLALLGWPLRRVLYFKPVDEAPPPTENPRPWSSLLMASYLRDIAIPMNQEVLYKWGLHEALLELREESY